MKITRGKALKAAGIAVAALLVAGVAAPYLQVNWFGNRIKWSLERALGRRVDIGAVSFSLFKGPGFSVEGVVIHEDPSIGIEPMARATIEFAPSLWALLGGRLVVSSIRLDDAIVNLTKTGSASEPGRWNFEPVVSRSLISVYPRIHVRNGRINFKFGDTKSVFYLTNTDVDIAPPTSRDGGWSLSCTGQPARTDRPAQGLGSFTANGHWYTAPDRLDMDVRLEQTGLGELIALLRGYSAGIHGTVSSRVHLAGPLEEIGISGQLTVSDIHRWDLLPSKGQGWPLDVRGRLNLRAEELDLESYSAKNLQLPLVARFRLSHYLSLPRWGVSVNWNQFPVEPLMELARHMGAELPPNLKLTGTMDGALGYSGQGSFQGEMAFHDTAVTMAGSPPVRFEQAHLVAGDGHVRLTPATVRTAGNDEARIEADYAWEPGTLDLSIATDAMKVESLRAQVALAAVPFLDRAQSGQWKGELRYRRAPGADPGWTGRLQLEDAEAPVAGLAHPLRIQTARAQIDGKRIVLDRIQAQVGDIEISGDYRYEPRATRPHRLRLRAGEVDAAELEDEMLPTLRRSGNLIARALGRVPVPEWLRDRAVDATLQIGGLTVAGTRLERVRARLLWDATRLQFEDVQATLDRASVSGALSVNLRGQQPAYALAAKIRGIAWQAGKMDVEGTLTTSGVGARILANLASEGKFSGAGVELGLPQAWRAISGGYSLAWAGPIPRLRLTDLQLRGDDEAYAGRGATQEDGKLVVVLSNGSRELRMSGTLAKLKLEEPTRP